MRNDTGSSTVRITRTDVKNSEGQIVEATVETRRVSTGARNDPLQPMDTVSLTYNRREGAFKTTINVEYDADRARKQRENLIANEGARHIIDTGGGC